MFNIPRVLGAFAAMALTATPAGAAQIFTGSVGENFHVDVLPASLAGEARPLRFQIDFSDISKLTSFGLYTYSEWVRTWTFDEGPGNPRSFYGDQVEAYDGVLYTVEGNSIRFTVNVDENGFCSAYKPPSYACDQFDLQQIWFDGTAVAGGTDYRMTVAVVPEPRTWALLIAGFGLAGASLRRRRVSSSVVSA